MFSQEIGKILIYAGLALLLMGTLVYFGSRRFSLGRLPGDFRWESGGFGVYFPLASSIIASIVLTVLVNLFWRR